MCALCFLYTHALQRQTPRTSPSSRRHASRCAFEEIKWASALLEIYRHFPLSCEVFICSWSASSSARTLRPLVCSSKFCDAELGAARLGVPTSDGPNRRRDSGSVGTLPLNDGCICPAANAFKALAVAASTAAWKAASARPGPELLGVGVRTACATS